MKKVLVTACLIGLALVGLQAQAGHNITIKVKGANRPYALLAYYYSNTQYIQDSAKVAADGTINFSGAKPYTPGMYLLVYSKSGKVIELLVDNGPQTFTLETDTLQPVKHMKVTASPANRMFYDYIGFIEKKKYESNQYQIKYNIFKDTNPDSAKAYTIKITDVDAEVKKYSAKVRDGQPNSFAATMLNANWAPTLPNVPKGVKDSLAYVYYYYKAHYWDKFPFLDTRITRTPFLYAKIANYTEDITAQQPDSISASIKFICDKLLPNPDAFQSALIQLANHYAADKRLGFDKIYVDIADAYYLNKKAWWIDSTTLATIKIQVEKLRPLLVGTIAPPLNLPDTNGVNIDLQSIEAKFTFLFFWDPDCSHCKEEMPKLLAFYDKAKWQGVEMYCVAGGSNKSQWKTFIKEYNLPCINVYDEFKQRKPYNIESFPELFVLDSRKAILIKGIEPAKVISYMQTRYGIKL